MALKNYQYDKLLREFDSRRMKSKFELDKRTEEIYNKIPEIKTINEKIAGKSVECGKQAILGDENALLELRRFISSCSLRKTQLLEAGGYPTDYLEPVYTCSKCADTGFIGTQPCTCFKSAVSALILDESNIRDIIEEENFENFRTDLYSDDPSDADPSTHITPYKNILNVLSKAKSFTANFDRESKNLLIYGNTGLGKTFLANCIAKELLDSAHTVQYYTAYNLFEVLRKYTFEDSDNRSDSNNRKEYMYQCDLLIIDDLGSELTNAFTSSELFAIINERSLKNLSTIISTNLSLNEIQDRYSERVLSRLSKSYDFIKLIGRDIRML